jgi:hypothetical protein
MLTSKPGGAVIVTGHTVDPMPVKAPKNVHDVASVTKAVSP